jgi:tetratricopeptide (TPR) repeat protein
MLRGNMTLEFLSLKQLQNLRTWLGEGRFWLLLGMLISTGIASFLLQFIQTESALVFQNMLVAAFFVGAAVLIAPRMSREELIRWAAILVPAFGLVVLGLFFVPDYLLAFMGGAFGWVLVGLFLFGSNKTRMEYQKAIKSLRKNDYKAAIEVIDELIKSESKDPNHYRFRAEVLRLWGKLDRARRDYQEMLNHSTNDADRAVAYNGLAEVDLQAGRYQDALEAAQKAYELAPGEWVTAYNLGMIADRMGNNTLAIESLEKALAAKMPDSRHRLLVYLWQARAYARSQQTNAAQTAIANLKKESSGLKEWQKILPDEQATVLRDVLEADIKLAEKLLNGESNLAQLGAKA